MSAWVVSKKHIDLLVSAGLRYGKEYALRWEIPVLPSGCAGSRERTLERASASSVGVMLWAENQKSVNHRYNQKDIEPELYEFKRYGVEIDPVVVLKSIRCYVYQSCEHAEWEQSEARAFCDALTLACLPKLPGYDAAPWGI